MDNKIMSPIEWAKEYSTDFHKDYWTDEEVQGYSDYVLSQQPKKDIILPLPEFLYEDSGEVRVGRHGDSSITDEWNAYVNKVKELNGIQ